MEFHRLGHVFAPTGDQPWARSHASTPFAVPRPDGRVDVYFSARDGFNRSHIGSVILAPHRGSLKQAGEPRLLLSPGGPDSFDKDGMSMGSIVEVDGASYLYYVGWNLRTDVPWRNTIGLAIREPGADQFRKFGPTPVLDVSEIDPFSVSYPWVDRVGDLWCMWYGTNLRWGSTPRDMDHAIRRAVSTDGINWERDRVLSIDLNPPEEYALSRPSVWMVADSTYQMLFSKRTRSREDSYELGLATSKDGVTWTRVDHVLHQGESAEQWDSEMACYAAVFEISGEVMALYCGNGFGRSGFGLARVEP